MKTQLITYLLVLTSHLLFAQTNIELLSNLTYDTRLNDIWGYVAEDGTEYALVGTVNGLSIVSLADPSNPVEVAFAPGSSSIWRDIKTWGQYAYVTTEARDGLQVVDLSNLPNEVSHFFWKPTLEENGTNRFQSAHNLYIDEHGYCYLVGSNLNNGGFIIADIFTDPLQPTIVGKGPPIYAHDIYVRNHIAYTSDIYEGTMSIHDVSNKDAINLLGSTETPFDFTHNTWLSDDGRTIFTTDERANAPTTAFDITDFQDIKKLDQFVPAATAGQGVIPHNVHVLNDFLVISHYGDGLVIVDAHRPSNLVEVGNFDTTPSIVTGFNGVWGAYPFLPSGLTLLSDFNSGLFVVKPSYKRAAYLEGIVTDRNGQGINDVSISLANINVQSDGRGAFQTGIPASGTFDVLIEKRDYNAQIVTVALKEGVVTPLNIVLEEEVSVINLSGLVATDEAGIPIEGAILQLTNGGMIIETHSDEQGGFRFDSLLAGTYTLIAGKWGYSTIELKDLPVSNTVDNLVLTLSKGVEDPFALDLGWEVRNDVDLGNGFSWDTPSFPRFFDVISNDVQEDIGGKCYMLNNGDTFRGIYFAGTAKLISPTFDLSGMSTPTISYATFSIIHEFLQVASSKYRLFVYLDNGREEVAIDTITTDIIKRGDTLLWEESIINVNDFLTPTNSMTIRFEFVGLAYFYKAGVDNFKVFDAGTSRNKVYAQPEVGFTVSPNPFTDQLSIAYNPADWDEQPQLFLLDAAGRIVYQQLLDGNRTIVVPANIAAGLYFAQLRNGKKESKVLKLVK